MNRIDIINSCIKKVGAKNYLEIGVQAGHCFRAIQCENKIGVDPDVNSAATVHKTSDNFFKTNKQKFDVIFIDGLHEADQVYKDILNSLECLSEDGIILMHDCLPTNEFMQLIPQTTQNEWTGDCWKAFVKLRTERNDLLMFVVNTDWGVGVIQKQEQPPLKVNVPLTYNNFVNNKYEWMNIVTVDEFKMYIS